MFCVTAREIFVDWNWASLAGLMFRLGLRVGFAVGLEIWTFDGMGLAI